MIPDISKFHTFLLDASGVIYNDSGVIPGVPETIRTLQKQGQVFVVTNNSFNNPHSISEKLQKTDILISPDHIISSGFGLQYDPEIQALIRGKRVFILGYEDSHTYAKLAGVSEITESIEKSDVILLMGSLKEKNTEAFNQVYDHLNVYPDKKVVVTNPDMVVKAKHGLKQVLGAYAKKLETRLKHNFIWVGKPNQNFSYVVKHILTENFNCSCDDGMIFFDDNVRNVQRMAVDLGIQGCWVRDTGISYNLNSRNHGCGFDIDSLGSLIG